MSKFDVRICNCGRIHFIDDKLVDEALEQDKNLMVICGGCGTTTLIGADREPDWEDPNKTVFNMYTYHMGQHDNFTLTADSFETVEGKKKGISKVFYSKGIQVMMETGYYAKSYDSASGRFQDIWYPDFWRIPTNATAEQYKAFIEQWQAEHVKVNMNNLLRSLTDEQAEALSHFYIEGLDWKGTKFEKEWHK